MVQVSSSVLSWLHRTCFGTWPRAFILTTKRQSIKPQLALCRGSVMRVFLLKRNCFFVNVESTCATTSCKWPLLVRDRDHFFGWQFYNFRTCHRLYLCSRDHLAHGLICTFAKCPTLTHTTQSMEELLVFCLAIQIFNLELAYYKFSSSSSLWISSRKRPPALRPATKLSPD